MAKTKFELYKDSKGHYRWRLIAQNGEAVASSGEGFTEKRTAMSAIKKLKDWANTESVIDFEKIKEEAEKAKEKAKQEEIKNKASKKVETKKVSNKKIAKPTTNKVATKAKNVVTKAKPSQTKKVTKEDITEDVKVNSVI